MTVKNTASSTDSGRWQGLPEWSWPGAIRVEAGTNKFIDKGWNAAAQARYRGESDVSSWLAELEEWMLGGGNIGWVPPVGVVVLDADNVAAFSWIANRAKKNTPINARGDKGHYFFKYDRTRLTLWNKNSIKWDTKDVELAVLDVRVATNRDGTIGGGGIVIPPSKRTDKSGGDYRWERKLPSALGDLPDLPEEIEYLLSTQFREASPMAKTGGVSRHDQLRNAIYSWVQLENADEPDRGKAEVQKKAEDFAQELFGNDLTRLKSEIADVSRSIDGAWDLVGGANAVGTNPSDASIAKTFLDYHDDNLLFVTNPDRMYFWDGITWGNLGGEESVKFELFKFSDYYQDLAARETNSDRRVQLLGCAKKLKGHRGVSSVLSTVKTLAWKPDHIDADLHLTTFPASKNGKIPATTYDAKGGLAYEPQKDDMISAIGTAPFINGATDEMVDRFFESLFPDPEVRGFAEEVLGQCLQGDLTQNEHFVVLVGPPATGKSTLMELMGRVLGKRVVIGARSIIDGDGERGGKDFSIAYLKGKNVAYFDEARNVRLGEQLKRITSGNTIVGHVKGGDDVEFASTARPFITTNTLPKAHTDDEGLKRRAIILHIGDEDAYEAGVTNIDADRHLKSKLLNDQACLSAFIQRIVGGVERVNARGGSYELPDKVVSWVNEWFDEADPLLAWFDGDGIEVTGDPLDTLIHAYQHYAEWAKRTTNRVMNAKTFGPLMKRHALGTKRTKNGVAYIGVRRVGSGHRLADEVLGGRSDSNSLKLPN